MHSACSANPDNPELQTSLKRSADQLTLIAYSSSAELLQTRVIRSLQVAARAAVTAGTQLVNVSQIAAKASRASNYQTADRSRCYAEMQCNDLIPSSTNAQLLDYILESVGLTSFPQLTRIDMGSIPSSTSSAILLMIIARIRLLNWYILRRLAGIVVSIMT
ncbi:unnamed protein product [Protopolystoma xenopodis]|uniref:Uncharacterized protein n=1 Tax=Protopolystoma xenopodis TaxID=117903 RepID=A0A448WK68_9PLAT|nr:unnamed protein product [Protopolystoma xenopodis]